MTSWDDEWAELIAALCADDPARIGTIGKAEIDPAHVHPTVFGWLAGFDWWPADEGTGIALLDLTEPGTMPPTAWERLCGPLGEATAAGEDRLLVGRHTPAGSPRSATLTLVTDRTSRVVTVRVRVEPA